MPIGDWNSDCRLSNAQRTPSWKSEALRMTGEPAWRPLIDSAPTLTPLDWQFRADTYSMELTSDLQEASKIFLVSTWFTHFNRGMATLPLIRMPRCIRITDIRLPKPKRFFKKLKDRRLIDVLKLFNFIYVSSIEMFVCSTIMNNIAGRVYFK